MLAKLRRGLFLILSVSALCRIDFASFAPGFDGPKRLILQLQMDGQ
jgi:hypothetical protein